MEIQYGLDEKPPFLKSCLIGLEWAAILICSSIILGKVVGSLHFTEPVNQINYLQKVIFVSGVVLFCQIFWGHRLPLLPGPAAVLFVGVIASQGFGMDEIYTSVMMGGIFITLLGLSGLLKYLRRFFTTNVVTVVLLLIAFAIAPEVLNLVIARDSGIAPFFNLFFAFTLIFVMLVCYRFLGGIWRSTLVMWAVVAGSLLYHIFFPEGAPPANYSDVPWVGNLFRGINFPLAFQPGVLISFFFCSIALSINELSSIQAVNEMLLPKDMDGRITRGVSITGLANAGAGFLGVIGPVDYTVSPGIIATTRCASRYTLAPTSVILLLLAFLPSVTGRFICGVPSVVVGAILAYVMMTQIGAGLMNAFKRSETFRFEDGLVIGASILLGTLVAFLPEDVINGLSPILRPILGNGFVVGVLCALLMEQLFQSRSSAGLKAKKKLNL